jgi:ribosomal protein S18 acetylase RimI-like enzyme
LFNDVLIREKSCHDKNWTVKLLTERWGSTTMVLNGEIVDLCACSAVVADDQAGLATYRQIGTVAELVSLDTVETGRGTGTAILKYLSLLLTEHGATKLLVTTTNDNLVALGFYQRRGFLLEQVRPWSDHG